MEGLLKVLNTVVIQQKSCLINLDQQSIYQAVVTIRVYSEGTEGSREALILKLVYKNGFIRKKIGAT